MLVLTRKTGESIQIGDDITIKIVAVEGDQIKLGIDVLKMWISTARKSINKLLKQTNKPL